MLADPGKTGEIYSRKARIPLKIKTNPLQMACRKLNLQKNSRLAGFSRFFPFVWGLPVFQWLKKRS